MTVIDEKILPDEIKEAKVLLLGQGSTGKSSLVQRIVKDTFLETTATHGMSIYTKILDYPKLKGKILINIWDLGGHQFLHETYKLFLSDCCIYIITIDSFDENQINYLKLMIKKTIEYAPIRIYIVLTRSDIRDYDKVTIEDIENSVIKPFIHGQEQSDLIKFHCVSSFTNDGIEKLKTDIFKCVYSSNKANVSNKTFRKLLDSINKRREKNVITYNEYKDICSSHSIFGSDQDEFLDKLKTSGHLTYYSKDIILNNYIILNPGWLDSAIVRVINFVNRRMVSKSYEDTNAILLDCDIQKIFSADDHFNSEYFSIIIRALHYFDFFYPIGKGDTHIIPKFYGKIGWSKSNNDINEKNEHEVYLNIQVSDKIHTIVKQYLVFFNDFVKKAKNKDIDFEVISIEDGLRLKLLVNDEYEFENIIKYLNEYIDFVKKNIDDLEVHFETNLEKDERTEFINDLKDEILHLNSRLKIKSDENKKLIQDVDRFYNLLKLNLSNPTPVFIKLNQDNINIQESIINHNIDVSEKTMGDKYEISGQVGSVGRNAYSHDINFNQIWNNISQGIDLNELEKELSTLRNSLRNEANTAEHDSSIGAVAKAEIAASEGNGSETLKQLKNAGKWALSVAEKIGTNVAAQAIKSSLGI